MMMKKQILTLLRLAGPILLLMQAACTKKDPNAPREEYIRVYDSPACEVPVSSTSIGVKGGTATLYIKSSVPFTAKWQDGQVPAWADVTAPQPVSDDVWKIDITADRISDEAVYERRSGVLMLMAPDIYLGNFFVVNQGLTARIACDFSWLNGSAKPNETINDVLMENWSNAWKNRGFSSTVIEGQESAWVYSKNGYIKLGSNDFMGADLLTPHTGSFQYDSLLVVSFKAVVQNGPSVGDFYAETEPIDGDGTDPDPGPGPGPDPEPDPEPVDPGSSSGTEPITPMPSIAIRRAPASVADVDDNTLTVEVIGGGVIRETGLTRIVLTDVPTYDRGSSAYPEDIFKDGSYLVFIASTPANPITTNTTIRFIAGSMNTQPAPKCSRIFIDDLYVYRVNARTDEDLFILNGSKSGRDKVLGGATEN